MSEVLQLDQQDVNLSIDSFLGSMNLILDEHAPLKQVNKYNLKFKSKPWIIPAIQTSISVKNYLPKRFIKSKDPQTKQIFCEQYKDYRNVLSTLLKKKNKLLFRVPHRCWEHWGGGALPLHWGQLFKIWLEGGGLSQYVGGAWVGPKMLSKNTCEGVYLIVKLPTIILQACKFTKNKLHTHFSRILARF